MASRETDALAEQIASLRASLAREPDDPSIHFGLGRALARARELEEAAAAFRRATELRSDYTAAWRELGRTHQALGRTQEAMEAFERGLAAAEESGDLQTAREIGVFLRRLAPVSRAEPAAPDAAAAANPEPAPAQAAPVSAEALAAARAIYREGFGHFARGELAEAIARYERALTLAPSLSIAWNGLSMALGQAGRLDEAVEAANRLVALEPEDPLSHTNLSRLLMQRGMIPEAEDARAKAMQLQMRQAR